MSRATTPIRPADIVRFADLRDRTAEAYQEAAERLAPEDVAVRDVRPRGLLWSMDDAALVDHAAETKQRMRSRPLVWVATGGALVALVGAPLVAFASVVAAACLAAAGVVAAAAAVRKEPEFKRYSQVAREVGRRRRQSQQDRFIEGLERTSLDRVAAGAEAPSETLVDLARRRDAAALVLDRAIISWMGLDVHELDDAERSTAVSAAREDVRLGREASDDVVALAAVREGHEGWGAAGDWTLP